MCLWLMNSVSCRLCEKLPDWWDDFRCPGKGRNSCEGGMVNDWLSTGRTRAIRVGPNGNNSAKHLRTSWLKEKRMMGEMLFSRIEICKRMVLKGIKYGIVNRPSSPQMWPQRPIGLAVRKTAMAQNQRQDFGFPRSHKSRNSEKKEFNFFLHFFAWMRKFFSLCLLARSIRSSSRSPLIAPTLDCRPLLGPKK